MPLITTTNVDNVAETIKFDSDMIIRGIDLMFKAKPSTDSPQTRIIVRWVECGPSGSPTNASSGEVSLLPSQVGLDSFVRFNFPDVVLCQNGKVYAFTIYSQSPEWQIYVARQGFFDLNDLTRLVGQNPFLTGVLLYSSNGINWSVLDDTDITFRLIGCRFVPGDVAVLQFNSVTLGAIQKIAALVAQQLPQGASVEWQYSADGQSYQPLAIGPENTLGATSNVIIARALLSTTFEFSSPIIDTSSFFLEGIRIKGNGLYVSRTVTLPGALNYQTLLVFLKIDRKSPVTSWLVEVSSDLAGTVWDAMTLDSTTIIDDEFVELALHKDYGASTKVRWKIRITYSTSNPVTEAIAKDLITIASDVPY